MNKNGLNYFVECWKHKLGQIHKGAEENLCGLIIKLFKNIKGYFGQVVEFEKKLNGFPSEL